MCCPWTDRSWFCSSVRKWLIGINCNVGLLMGVWFTIVIRACPLVWAFTWQLWLVVTCSIMRVLISCHYYYCHHYYFLILILNVHFILTPAFSVSVSNANCHTPHHPHHDNFSFPPEPISFNSHYTVYPPTTKRTAHTIRIGTRHLIRTVMVN